MTKPFKTSKTSYFEVILDHFRPNLGKNELSWKKEVFQFLNIAIIYNCAKKTTN